MSIIINTLQILSNHIWVDQPSENKLIKYRAVHLPLKQEKILRRTPLKELTVNKSHAIWSKRQENQKKYLAYALKSNISTSP